MPPPMNDQIQPREVTELAGIIATAARAGQRLSIRGGGSKDGAGAPSGAMTLDMSAFAGVIQYDPAELVLTTGAATPLSEIQALVAESGQMLAFEPFDHGPIYGRPTGRATIGGVIAAGVAGSQRLSHGGARDHLLGFEAVSGKGERFVAGGKVVKNVTGYDLPKLASGSRGRLFALTQVTLKVLPAPRTRTTLVVRGLDFPTARHAMSSALGSAAEVAAAAYIPASSGRPAITALRLQGFRPSVEARTTVLAALLGACGGASELLPAEADSLWRDLRTLDLLDQERALWRINIAPSQAPGLVGSFTGDWVADWGGGLIWLASDAEPTRIRCAALAAKGHATLVRASETVREVVPMFHPPQPGIAALEARIRRAFDPAGVFETGRFSDQGQ